ncbi:MAG: protein kinase [Vicinamibacterales bacterium]
MRTSIGRYRVERVLGEGGMGVVYGAHDDQLGRRVAIKTIREETGDSSSRDRLWREARAAASVNHPNICHVYEVGTEQDAIYLVMEWLDGEPLSARVSRGPMPVGEAMPIANGILAALEALHDRGIVHRDLKPANVFLTPHGVKLVDFGLARGRNSGPTLVDMRVTLPGLVAGTPRYMAPEQLQGENASPASDLFAFGAVLFEMLAGEPPFDGSTVWDSVHAILHDPPRALTGGHGTAALNAIVHRCLAKQPQERPPDAKTVAAELRAAVALIDSSGAAPMRAATRLMVLPFKILRPDPDVDFLGFSLPDALVASLAGLGPLVVRSSAVAQQFAGDAPDLRRIASEGQVDAVVTGTLLRSGDRLRLVAQLVEAPGGTILWSKTAQVAMGDIFDVQDDLARQIVDSLAIPLTTLGRGLLGRDVPASGHAYELYLRGNHLAHGTVEPARLLAARELYAACLAEDPNYAPAWARIGRVHRVLTKYGRVDSDGGERAREAFERAFALNPELPLAHHLYTYLEIEQGHAERAIARLLTQIRKMPNDPDLFSGLVAALRFCGLLEASVAADARARQLDPSARTSVEFTWALLLDEEKLRRFDDKNLPLLTAVHLFQEGRTAEAMRLIEGAPTANNRADALFVRAALAAVENRASDVLAELNEMRRVGFPDPEGWAFFPIVLAHVGLLDEAATIVEEIVGGNYICPEIRNQPWMEPMKGHERFEGAIAQATAARERAMTMFVAADGPRLLGMLVA